MSIEGWLSAHKIQRKPSFHVLSRQENFLKNPPLYFFRYSLKCKYTGINHSTTAKSYIRGAFD